MTTSPSYLSKLGQVLPLPEWRDTLGVAEIGNLLSNSILKVVPAGDLVDFSGIVKIDSVPSEVTVSVLNGEPHFIFSGCTAAPIRLGTSEEYRFARLDVTGFLDSFRRANGISTQMNPFILPQGFLYMGCKVIKNNHTLHFLGKDFVCEEELLLLRTFLETHESNNLKFVFLVSEAEVLKSGLSNRFSKSLSIGLLPSLSGSLRVSLDLIYKSEFGFDFDMVRTELPSGLVIDSKSGQVAFCGEVIWSEVETDFLKFLIHLAKNRNKKVSHSVLIQDVLRKTGLTSISKVIRDQKDTFHKKVKDKFGKESTQAKLAKKVLPELPTSDRGFSMLTNEFVEIILL